jgi:UDP-N-acetylmuramate--alanine ligase
MNFQDIKNQTKIHFIGVGGIGMSALALILREFDIQVQGSDLSENYLTAKLRDKNIKYIVGHNAENIDSEVSLIVQTSIIKTENPEIIEAEKRGIKIITRAELLAIIMGEYQGVTIAGTHGKTSTTAMVAVMMQEANLDPTVINGGVIHYFSSNSKIGKGKYLVAESDESDASFVILPTSIGAITNIEAEHLEFKGYNGDFDKQKQCFEQYVDQIAENGLCVLCLDSEEVKIIYQKLSKTKKNLITYSAFDEADLMVRNIKNDVSGISFDIIFKDGRKIEEIKIPIYGEHNASNAAVAVGIGDFIGLTFDQIKNGLSKFNGVKRRFTKVGEFQGVSIIDDYAHHPTEISTTLKAARLVAKNNKVICVIEPHKYSRIASLFNEFCSSFSDADIVIVTEIYSAGQQPIEGITQDSIIEGIKKTNHNNVIKLNHFEDLAKIVKPLINKGDLIFCAGAGKITYLAADLEKQLENGQLENGQLENGQLENGQLEKGNLRKATH